MATVKINGKTFKPPKKRIANPMMADEKYTGEEPSFIEVEFKDESDRRLSLMKAFGYYNYYYTGKHFKKDLIKYAKDELKYAKDKLALLDIAPDWNSELQSGALLRMRSRGLTLLDSELLKIQNNVQKLLDAGTRKSKEQVEEDDKPKSPVTTIQDRIRNKVSETVLGDLEDMLDRKSTRLNSSHT